MQMIKIGKVDKGIDEEIIKFSDNPIYYGIGFKVGSENWKLFKENDILEIKGKKYKINQHIDVGDYTWFLFTAK